MTNKTQGKNLYGIVGSILTVIYLIVLVAFVCLYWDSFQKMVPNSWGDFLAGTIGPLALIWVVLGFFLQGRELQHSVEALNLQAKELRNSVVQQTELAQSNREMTQFDCDRRATDLWLEASKLESDTDRLLIEISHLFPEAIASRKAVLNAIGKLKSGAMESFNNNHKNLGEIIETERTKYREIRDGRHLGNRNASVELVSALYDNRSKLQYVHSRLTEFLEEDAGERGRLTQEKIASRATTSISAKYSGR